MFEKKNTNTLLEHCPYDYTIDLEKGRQFPFKSICSTSQDNLAALCEYIDENLEKGFIRHSKSLFGAPILFVKNKEGIL